MLLALSVISENAANLGQNGYKVFDERGGTIGRVSGNDWILPDPDKFVSSRHAMVRCDSGRFLLSDTSTNGTFINSQDQPMARDRPVPLADGDRLFIGEYEILVQLIEEAMAGAPEPVIAQPAVMPAETLQGETLEVASLEDSPFDLPADVPADPASNRPSAIPSDYQITGYRSPAGSSASSSAAPQPRARPAEDPPDLPEAVDPLLGLPAARSEPQRLIPPAPAAPLPPPGATAFRQPAALRPAPASAPPSRAPAPSAQPLRPAAAPPPPRPAAPTSVAASDGGADLLSALGLDPSRIDPVVYEQLGTIVRIVVQGLIEVLQSRAEIKNNFRMPMTSIRPVENNPLKFSMNADDALHNLFVKRNPGYLPPVESFQEAFQDVAFHQLAMLAGVRAAYDAMLAKLHPDRLEEIYERKLKRTALLNMGRQSKFWDLYREQFEDIDRDAEAHFQMLFGEEFAKAYNDQLQRLNAAARARQR
jgi:type VI secretion system FHA domain protein